MDEDETVPITVYKAVECVRAGVPADGSGTVSVIFSLPSGAELAVELSPLALATLEEMLATIRAEHASAHLLS